MPKSVAAGSSTTNAVVVPAASNIFVLVLFVSLFGAAPVPVSAARRQSTAFFSGGVRKPDVHSLSAPSPSLQPSSDPLRPLCGAAGDDGDCAPAGSSSSSILAEFPERTSSMHPDPRPPAFDPRPSLFVKERVPAGAAFVGARASAPSLGLFGGASGGIDSATSSPAEEARSIASGIADAAAAEGRASGRLNFGDESMHGVPASRKDSRAGSLLDLGSAVSGKPKKQRRRQARPKSSTMTDADSNGEYKFLILSGVPPVEEIKLVCGPGSLGIDFRPYADRKIVIAGGPMLEAASWLCRSRSKSQRLAVAELLLQQLFRVMTGAALLAAMSWEPLGEQYCTTIPEVHGVSLKLWCKTRGEDVSIFIDYSTGRLGVPEASQNSVEIIYTFGDVNHNDTGNCSCGMARNAIMEAQRGMIWAFGDTKGETIQSLHDLSLFMMPGLAGRTPIDAAGMKPKHFALQHVAFCFRYALDHGVQEQDDELASTVSDFRNMITKDADELVNWKTWPTNIKAGGLIINGARFLFVFDQYIDNLIEHRGLSPTKPWCEITQEDMDEGSTYAVLVPSGSNNKTKVLRGMKAMPETAQKAVRADMSKYNLALRHSDDDATMKVPPAVAASDSDDEELPDLIDETQEGNYEHEEEEDKAQEDKIEKGEEGDKEGGVQEEDTGSGITESREARELSPTAAREAESDVPMHRDQDVAALPFDDAAELPFVTRARHVTPELSRGVSDWVFGKSTAQAGGTGADRHHGSVAKAASLWRAGAERRRLMRMHKKRQSYSLAILREAGVAASDVAVAERSSKMRTELFKALSEEEDSSDSDSDSMSTDSDFSIEENYFALPRLTVETVRRRRSKSKEESEE